MNPILALIIANVIWGAASPIFKYSLGNIPPFTLAFVRFFFASYIFLPFLSKDNPKILTKKDWVNIFLGSFFGIFINISFFFLGLQKTESINAPVIASSGPLFIFIFSILYLREKPKMKVFIGMITSLIGVMIIIFSPILLGHANNKIGELEGNLMLVVATIASVVSPIVLKETSRKISANFLSFTTFMISAVAFLPFMLFELKSWGFGQIDVAGLLGVIFGIFLSSAAAYFLYYYGISKIAAQEVGVFSYIDPVIAVIIAVPLLHEYPNIFFFLGSVLVFAGIYVSEGRLHYHPIARLRKK